jgi:hypothetical protein
MSNAKEPHMHGHNYWIGVVSKDHVDLGTAGGFTQLNHGKAAPLERMRAGDGYAFYSPRTAYPDGEPLQAFTAIGRIRTGMVYQVRVTDDFRPFRVDVDFLASQPAPIKPLIERLSFIGNKKHWGAAFRFGMLRIPEDDFLLIAESMECPFAERSAAAAAPSG